MADSQTADTLRNYFVVSLIVGTSGILVGWLLESALGQIPAVLITVVIPLLGMAWYIYAGVAIDMSNQSTDMFADSIYYLGFLLTLIALIFSLFAINPESEGTSGLILRFGVALSTTVVGLAARTYFSSFRASAKDEFRRLEHELTQSAQEVRDRFKNMSEVMTLQTEAFKESLQKANSDLDRASDEIGASASRLSGSVENSASTIDQSSRGLGQSTVEFSEQLGETMSEVSAGLDDIADLLTEKVESIELPPDLFTKQFEAPSKEYGESLQELTKQIRGHSEALSELETHNRQLMSAISDTIEKIGDASSESAKKIEDAGGKVETLAKRLSSISSQMDQVVASYKEHEKVVNETAGKVELIYEELGENSKLSKRHREALESELENSRSALIQMRRELVGAAEYIQEELNA